MPTQTCGARTSWKNAARGRPCKQTRIAANGRCRFHGGFSTGPRTAEGRARIAAAQQDRWRVWKAANPKLFPDVGIRQEQRIKKGYRMDRHRQNLRSQTESWLISRYGDDWQAGMLRALEEMQRRRAEEVRQREARKPLTPEQNALADQFLVQWQAKATRSETKEWVQHLLNESGRGYVVRDTPTAEWIARQIEDTKAGATTQSDNTGSEQAPHSIARQPAHRVKRLQYMERQERTQAHAQELIERYGLDKQRPTVRVGHAGKKRR